MKNAMLFIVALLFSVSASAATLTLTSTDGNSGDISQTVPWKASAIADQAATDVDIVRRFSLVSDVDTRVKFELGPNEVTSVTQWSLDLNGSKTQGLTLTENVVRSLQLTAGQAITVVYQVVFGDLGNTSTLTVKAVPVPAALFLFAPALLGFLGLRRKATLAA